MGTTAPQGWLICNGQTVNIADYPELATHFASHFGSANFFGGDGTTTIAVPDTTDITSATLENGVFCIKATVSGDPNGHVYSTEEQVVGTWIDGNQRKHSKYA
jgi:microcystin-dependent protein